jgi:hypothetical protein
MPNYKLYCIDGAGHFSEVHDFHPVNDADALQQARKMKLSSKCEIWQLNRLVAKLGAQKQA